MGNSDSVSQPLVSRSIWLSRSFWRIYNKSLPITSERKPILMKDHSENFNFDVSELYERKSINMKTSDLSKPLKFDFNVPELYERKTINIKTSDLYTPLKLDFNVPELYERKTINIKTSDEYKPLKFDFNCVGNIPI